MDRSEIVKMFHCYTRGENNMFQQAKDTCSIVCVLRLSLIHIQMCIRDSKLSVRFKRIIVLKFLMSLKGRLDHQNYNSPWILFYSTSINLSDPLDLRVYTVFFQKALPNFRKCSTRKPVEKMSNKYISKLLRFPSLCYMCVC